VIALRAITCIILFMKVEAKFSTPLSSLLLLSHIPLPPVSSLSSLQRSDGGIMEERRELGAFSQQPILNSRDPETSNSFRLVFSSGDIPFSLLRALLLLLQLWRIAWVDVGD